MLFDSSRHKGRFYSASSDYVHELMQMLNGPAHALYLKLFKILYFTLQGMQRFNIQLRRASTASLPLNEKVKIFDCAKVERVCLLVGGIPLSSSEHYRRID